MFHFNTGGNKRGRTRITEIWLWPQADYTMCLRLIIVDIRRTKSVRVMNKALKLHTKITYWSEYLNKVKWNVNRCICDIFRLHGPFAASFLRNYFRPAKDNSAKERSKRLMKAKNTTNASINISFNFIEILRPRRSLDRQFSELHL